MISTERKQKLSEKWRGNNNPMKNPEIKKKVIKKIKGRKRTDIIGDNNPMRKKDVVEKVRNKLKGKLPEWVKKYGNPMKRPEVRQKLSKLNRGERNPNFGKHPSEETRKKRSNAIKKLWQNSEFRNRIISKQIGHSVSLETRKKISKLNQGSNTWNWKGGVTPENERIRHSLEMKLWRKAVFERDNWTCQKCGHHGGKLHAHHIFNYADYPEQRFNIDNGITLCENCHMEFHKKYGINNNTKEQLEECLKLC
jgi:hypothetical protein